MNLINKKNIFISILFLAVSITAICIRVDSQSNSTKEYVMGATLSLNATYDVSNIDIIGIDVPLSRQTISIMNNKAASLNETYFRPSKLKAINNNFNTLETLTQAFPDTLVAPSLMNEPSNSVINYFSVLQQASNLTDTKFGGCGTVGFANLPFPIAYNFLSSNYKHYLPYDNFLASFEGIGHINLIKLVPIKTTQNDHPEYFVELEAIEGTDIGATTFNYYYGKIQLVDDAGIFYIDSMTFTPEDFLCAAYHGWSHNAESYVEIVYGNWCGMIKKQYSPKQDDFKKVIQVDGIDGKKYNFEFARLANGTDYLISTLVKDDNNKWIPVKIDVDKCLEKLKQSQSTDKKE